MNTLEDTKTEKTIEYSLISKYRSVLMGIAILLIMFCHLDTALYYNGLQGTTLASILHTCTVGVDIFLFLSGMGLYYSYTGKSVSYASYMKRRLQRILPPYFVIGGLTYFIYDTLIQHLSFLKMIKDFLFISWFQEGLTRYWYIFAIIIFYFLFPFIYKVLNRESFSWVSMLAFFIIWWLVIETLSLQFEEVERFRIALSRFPIFIFGIYCGKISFLQLKARKMGIMMLLPFGYIALLVLKKCISRPLYDYLYYPVRAVLGISIIISVIIAMELLESVLPQTDKLLFTVLKWFGGLTLELYLLHQSYLILFGFPYKLLEYTVAAFILPTITVMIIDLKRSKKKKGLAV